MIRLGFDTSIVHSLNGETVQDMIAKSRKMNRYERENLLSLFKRKPNKYDFDDFMNQNLLHMDL